MPQGDDRFPQPTLQLLPPSSTSHRPRPYCASGYIAVPISTTTTKTTKTTTTTTTKTTPKPFAVAAAAAAAAATPEAASASVSPTASTIVGNQASASHPTNPRYRPASPTLSNFTPGQQWKTPDIGRYGLTYTDPSCDPSFDAVSASLLTPTSDPTSPTAPSHTESSHPPRYTTTSQTKRQSDEELGTTHTQPSPLKKARTRLAPPRFISLPNQPPPSAILARRNQGLISPLFFSSSGIRRQMPPRPNPLPPSDAAAVLLARLREDTEAVHTVRLPRGTVHSHRPVRSGSTPGSSSLSSSADATLPSSTKSPNSQTLPQGLHILRGVGVVELLEQDERPTFIIDLANPVNIQKTGLHLLYANAALRASAGILELLSVEGDDTSNNTDYVNFKSWTTSFVLNHESLDVCLPSHKYGGITWTCSTLRKRFRFVSGSTSAVSTAPDSPGPLAEESAVLEQRSIGPTPDQPPAVPMDDEPDYFGDIDPDSHDDTPLANDCVMMDNGEKYHSDEFTQQVFQAAMSKPSYDWTRIQATPDLGEHILFCRQTDWASTSLGPIEHWTPELRAMANMVMGSPHPAAMYWGEDYVTIYNEAYIELAGQKHPKLMGARYQDAWSEIWGDLGPIVNNAWTNGQAVMKNDNQLFINRHGFLEETFFSWSLIPLLGSEGQVVGLYNPAFENTRRKVNERRMLTLREVGEKTAAAKDVRGFWSRVKEGLEFNDVDVPLALIYSVKDDNSESEVSSMHSGSIAHPPLLQLEGSLGVPEGHPAALSHLDLKSSDEGFAPYMRQSMTMQGAPIVLSSEAGNLPTKLLEGLDWRGFGDPSRTIVILPVHPTTAGESVVGFIILGTNPRRPYDDEYQLFIHLLSRQLATSMASVVLFEEEIRRGQRAARLAALDRQELQMELYLRTQEAVESEYKFTRMAEFAPVGIFIANDKGLINFANDMWWQISRHPKAEDSVNTWMQSVMDEDRPGVERSWRQLIEEKEPMTIEFRFKCSRQNGLNTIDTWVLMSAFPEQTEDGNLKSIFACITDISPQKWAEDFQKQRREEAVELKRQQENFIDITSHEMRNPLSAVLQCADEIVNSIAEYRSQQRDDKQLEVLLEGCAEAAHTINLCASHQKRIVDDVLTLSKLDSQLLLVTPVDSHPTTVVRHVIKMFESELNTHDIKLEFSIDQAYVTHAVDWVRLDPSRLSQVLINLMTNAIKFTQGREKRVITMRMSASKNITEVTEKGVSFFPTRKEDVQALTKEKDWGTGEEINLHFSVQDTGPGLREDEKKLLFQRFSQASPRTHVQYGGSGLGLFISRMLAELQGGQIGVVSEKGIGSTFAFYVKCRKTATPSSESATLSALNLARPIKNESISAPKALPLASLPSRTTPKEQVVTETLLYDVLIVEDNIVNQRVLRKQLQNCGNKTHVANHGGEALDQLKKSRFWAGKESSGFDLSVILMDLEMPVMDGMTCAKRIRELEREGTLVTHIPIIAVTAYARPEQIESAKAAGIDDVISKPFRIPDLMPKIEELVSKYRAIATVEPVAST